MSGNRRQTRGVQKLNSRVEELANKVSVDFDRFKSELRKNIGSSGASGDAASQDECFLRLEKEFTEFEATVKGCLQDICTELVNLRTEINRPAAMMNGNIILCVQEDLFADIYENVSEVVTTKIRVEVKKSDFNFCYRLGSKKQDANKPRPIVVSFCQRWLRDKIFYGKRALKGKQILFTEMLTDGNLKLFREARKQFGNSCWTNRGLVYVLKNGARTQVTSMNQLKGWLEEAGAASSS